MARFFPMKKEDFDNLFPEHQEPLNPIIGLKILNPPNKTAYTEGDVFDPTGMSVALEHKDGTTDDITSRISYIPSGALTKSNTSVSISYDTFRIPYDISVGAGYKIVTWKDGTDEEIVAMVKAHYDGKIDLYDYWEIGDYRIIPLAAMNGVDSNESHVAQNIIMVLMNKGGIKITETQKPCAFVVGQRNCLLEKGCISSNNSSTMLNWSQTLRREWCNNEFRNAFPEALRSIFLQYDNITQKYVSTSAVNYITTSDYFSLFSVGNIRGTSSSDEGKKFEYYNTTVNLEKNQGNTGSSIRYWLRTPQYNTTYKRWEFTCYPTATGANGQICTANNGLAMFGCI